MSAIEELRQRLAAEAEQKEQDETAKRNAELERQEAIVREQFGDALLDELRATFSYDGRVPQMTLIYRGHEGSFKLSNGLRGDYGLTPEQRLVSWMTQVDRDVVRREAERVSARRVWLAKLRGGMNVSSAGLEFARDSLKCKDLLNDPELAEALEAYGAKVAALEELLAAEQAAQREARERARQAERAQLLTVAATATEWNELWDLADRVSSDYGCRGDLCGDEELVAAYEAAVERVRALEQHREAMLAEAQAEAFRPFDFYRVTEGVIGVLDGEAMVQTATFDSLTAEPDERGFWHPQDRDWPVRVHNLVHVEQITVSEPGEMPRWCPTVETEWGAIRVPPGRQNERA